MDSHVKTCVRIFWNLSEFFAAVEIVEIIDVPSGCKEDGPSSDAHWRKLFGHLTRSRQIYQNKVQDGWGSMTQSTKIKTHLPMSKANPGDFRTISSEI